MTLSPWIIYLWGIADQIQKGLAFAGFMSLFAGIMFLLGSLLFSDPGNSPEENGMIVYARRKSKLLIPLGMTLLIISTLLPSSKTIAIMVVAPAIINSEPIQKDLPEIYQMAREALKQTLEVK